MPRISEEMVTQLKEDIDADVLTVQEIARKHGVNRRLVLQALHWLGVDKEERSARVRENKSLAGSLGKVEDLEQFKRDLEDFSLLNNDIIMKHNINNYIFKMVCEHIGVDPKRRKDESKDERSRRGLARKNFSNELTWRDVSMSGDGRSLELLTRPWK